MARGRKNGCPVNVRNWQISILDVSTNEYVRIHGLTSVTRSMDSSTEDGSNETDTWEEPFVSKRCGSLSLEGDPVVNDSTGANDPGQELLNYYADQAGCDADCTIKLVDPYGHASLIDCIVTGREESADTDGTELSWDLEQVGEAEALPYIACTGIGFAGTGITGSAPTQTLEASVGSAPVLVTVAFTPEDASCTRYKVATSNRNVVAISDVTDDGFTLNPISAGSATVTITSISGGNTARLTVTVSA